MRKVLLSRISFSALMLTFLTFIFLFFNFTSAGNWDKPLSGGGSFVYVNETQTNSSVYWGDLLSVHSTQFNKLAGILSLNTNWLENFIINVDKWDNYYTKTQSNNRYLQSESDPNYFNNPNQYYNSTTIPQSYNLAAYYNRTEIDNILLNYYNDSEVDVLINDLNISFGNYYNKTEVDSLINGIPTPDLTIFYNKTEVDNLLNDYYPLSNPYGYLNESYDDSWINNTFYNQTQVDNLINGIDLSIYYTKTESDNTFVKLSNLVSLVGNWTLDKIGYYTKVEIDNKGYLQSESDPTYYSNPNAYYNSTTLPNIDLSPYWKSDGTSTATGDWDLESYSFNAKNIHYDALKNNYLGDSATPSLSTGHDNFYVNGAGAKTTTGYNNIGIGDANTLKEMTAANRNIAIGGGALGSLTTNLYTQNIGVGTNAGRYYATSTKTRPKRSMYLGHYTQASGSTPNNENVFGYGAIGKGSNTFVFGQVGSTAQKYYMYGDWINLKDNKYIILGAGEDFKIGYDGTNAVFNTSAVGSGIAYFSNNVSATGYITRTTIYDKDKGNALDWVKDSSQLKDTKGIDHTQFYGYTKHNVTDLSRPVERKVCNDVEDENGKITTDCYIEIDYPYKTEEEGIMLDEEVAMLTQAVYELKQQNQFLQEQINNLTGKDTKIEEANTRQDKALCSIKLFDWCLIK